MTKDKPPQEPGVLHVGRRIRLEQGDDCFLIRHVSMTQPVEVSESQLERWLVRQLREQLSPAQTS